MMNSHAFKQAEGPLTEDTACTGVLFILVGPAGVGKNTIMEGILGKFPQLRQLPTMTTRAIRKNEQQGIQHFFVTVDEFRDLIARQALIEYQEVYPGKFYGTPRQLMETSLDDQQRLIADIEFLGAGKLKAAFPDNVILIFIAPPSLDDLEKRLRKRGHMPEEEIAERLARATAEMSYADQCDYRVLNDTLEHSIDAVMDIIGQELTKRNCL